LPQPLAHPPPSRKLERVKTILTCLWGATGVTPVYIVRHQLISKDKDDDPPFGEEDTKYTSIYQEMIARTPTLTGSVDYNEEYKTLKTNGSFSPAFLADLKKVWAILHQCCSTSSAWQHVKKSRAQQNGCQVWCTLHNHFFGGKITPMCYDILSTLKSLHYSGNHKNFNFKKYCTTHVEQHNWQASLMEYNMAPLEESM
jgi:hypothetical protein